MVSGISGFEKRGRPEPRLGTASSWLSSSVGMSRGSCDGVCCGSGADGLGSLFAMTNSSLPALHGLSDLVRMLGSWKSKTDWGIWRVGS